MVRLFSVTYQQLEVVLMRKLALTALSLGVLALSAMPASAQMMQMAEDAEEVSFTATVVDLSCKVVYNLSGDDHRMCSQACADNGIPLGLVTADGTFYLPSALACRAPAPTSFSSRMPSIACACRARSSSAPA